MRGEWGRAVQGHGALQESVEPHRLPDPLRGALRMRKDGAATHDRTTWQDYMKVPTSTPNRAAKARTCRMLSFRLPESTSETTP